MNSGRDSLVVFTIFLELVVGSSTNERLLIEVSWKTLLMKCPWGMMKYVDTIDLSESACVLCGIQMSISNIFLNPYITYSLRQGLSLIDWLGCLFSELQGPTCLCLPSLGITALLFTPWHLFLHGLWGTQFRSLSFHNKYLTEGWSPQPITEF